MSNLDTESDLQRGNGGRVLVNTESESRAQLTVLLVSSSSGSQGGGELYLLGLAEGLVESGIAVKVMLGTEPQMDELGKRMSLIAPVTRFAYVNTYRRRMRSVGGFGRGADTRRISTFIAGQNADVVHLNKQNVEDGIDLLKAVDMTGLPSVCTIHNVRSMKSLGARFGRIRDWVARRALRSTDCAIITVAEQCKDDLNDYIGRSGINKVRTVLNGVGPAPGGDRRGVRAEWGCDDSDIVIGCLARLEHEKNPMFLIECVRNLPSHVHLVWVGDGRERSAVASQIDAHGLGSRVHLDGWRNDGRRRMVGFDIFALASSYEGFPLALIEGMAAGLPCMASDIDGVREAIVEGETGFRCPVKCLSTWTTRFASLIESSQLRSAMGQLSRRRWQERFSLNRMAAETVSIYREVMGDRRVA